MRRVARNGEVYVRHCDLFVVGSMKVGLNENESRKLP